MEDRRRAQGSRGRFLLQLVMSLGTLSFVSAARAAGPLGTNGAPIQTSAYSIDLYQGAVWAGSKVTSLGGSYVAVAYDVDGMLQNPATPAVRPFFSFDEFDYWLGLGLTFPSSFDGMDFFNSGTTGVLSARPDTLVYVTPAAILQFGAFGIGVSLEYQTYNLGEIEADDGAPRNLRASFLQSHIQAAYSLFRGELVLGGGLRVLESDASVSVNTFWDDTAPLSASGLGVEVGVLWQPHGRSFKLGFAYRSAVVAVARFSDSTFINEENDIILETSRGRYYLPSRVELPWDLNFGLSYAFGETTPNRPWRSSDDVMRSELLDLERRRLALLVERDRSIATAENLAKRQELITHYALALADLDELAAQIRRIGYYRLQTELAQSSRAVALVSASLLVSGRVEDAVGIESFLTQVVNRSGQVPVYSPRLGSEIEPFADWLRVRAGAYLEPTRFASSSPRAHYTGGLDIPVGVWNVFGLWPDDYRWRLTGSIDIARDFSTIGVSIGGWYPRHRGSVKLPDDWSPPALEAAPLEPWPLVQPGG